MNALTLTLFVSAVLAVGWLGSFLVAVNRRDQDHADRLSILPLDDDDIDVLSKRTMGKEQERAT